MFQIQRDCNLCPGIDLALTPQSAVSLLPPQVSLINENLDLYRPVVWRYYEEVVDEKDDTKKDSSCWRYAIY